MLAWPGLTAWNREQEAKTVLDALKAGLHDIVTIPEVFGHGVPVDGTRASLQDEGLRGWLDPAVLDPGLHGDPKVKSRVVSLLANPNLSLLPSYVEALEPEFDESGGARGPSFELTGNIKKLALRTARSIPKRGRESSGSPIPRFTLIEEEEELVPA